MAIANIEKTKVSKFAKREKAGSLEQTLLDFQKRQPHQNVRFTGDFVVVNFRMMHVLFEKNDKLGIWSK